MKANISKERARILCVKLHYDAAAAVLSPFFVRLRNKLNIFSIYIFHHILLSVRCDANENRISKHFQPAKYACVVVVMMFCYMQRIGGKCARI